jgi:hypothetical protein
MEKNSKSRLRIIVVCVSLIIAIGLIAIIIIYKNRFDYTSADGEHKVFAELCKENMGLVDLRLGYWSNTNYTIYYDGTIETEAVYKSEEGDYTSESKVKMSKSDFDLLKKNLVAVKQEESYEDGIDGATWDVNVYDSNGECTAWCSGYIIEFDTSDSEVRSILSKYDETTKPDYMSSKY